MFRRSSAGEKRCLSRTSYSWKCRFDVLFYQRLLRRVLVEERGVFRTYQAAGQPDDIENHSLLRRRSHTARFLVTRLVNNRLCCLIHNACERLVVLDHCSALRRRYAALFLRLKRRRPPAHKLQIMFHNLVGYFGVFAKRNSNSNRKSREVSPSSEARTV